MRCEMGRALLTGATLTAAGLQHRAVLEAEATAWRVKRVAIVNVSEGCVCGIGTCVRERVIANSGLITGKLLRKGKLGVRQETAGQASLTAPDNRTGTWTALEPAKESFLISSSDRKPAGWRAGMGLFL